VDSIGKLSFELFRQPCVQQCDHPDQYYQPRMIIYSWRWFPKSYKSYPKYLQMKENQFNHLNCLQF